MSDAQITRAEFFGGFSFFVLQLFLSYSVVWANLNLNTVIIGGLGDYWQVTWISLIVAVLNTIVLAISGDKLVYKIVPSIGAWVLVGVVGYYLGLLTLSLFWAETIIVTAVSTLIGLFHWAFA